MAEQKFFQLNISKVDGLVYGGEVIAVTVPGTVGEMTVLADHEPLISPLKAGTITVTKNLGATETFPVESGTMEVADNKVTILL